MRLLVKLGAVRYAQRRQYNSADGSRSVVS